MKNLGSIERGTTWITRDGVIQQRLTGAGEWIYINTAIPYNSTVTTSVDVSGYVQVGAGVNPTNYSVVDLTVNVHLNPATAPSYATAVSRGAASVGAVYLANNGGNLRIIIEPGDMWATLDLRVDAAVGDTGASDTLLFGWTASSVTAGSAGAGITLFSAAWQSQLSVYQQTSQKGAANGYASLDSGGKLPTSQLPSSVMEYKGVWNASTNTPTLADGTGDNGDQYRVSVAGTRDLGSGSITFDVGDLVIYNGSVWEKSDTTDAVASVAGKTGVVTLVKGDVGLGNVDNTSDANKPISTATQTALNGKEATITAGTTSQYWRGDKSWQTLDKTAVGLANVDNVSIRSALTGNNAVYNGNLEIVDPTNANLPDGWTSSGTGTPTVSFETTAPLNGRKSFKISNPNTSSGANLAQASNTLIPVVPGDQWYLAGRFKSNVATTSGLYFRAFWYKADGSASATQYTDIVANGAYSTTSTIKDMTVTVPSDAYLMQMAPYAWTANVAYDAYIDGIEAYRVANMPLSTTQKTYVDQISSRRPSYSFVSPPTGAPNNYDLLRGIYNYKPSNSRRIDNALANAMAGGMADMVFIGDSLSAGCVSGVGTNFYFDRLRSVPLAFRDQLATMGVPAAGTGLIRYVDDAYIDSRHVFSGTWSGYKNVTATTAAGATVTTTLDRGGTMLDVQYYSAATSGTFTITVDGTLVGTINTAGTASVKRARVAVNTSIGSTVVINATVPGTGGVWLYGVEAWTPNAGMRIHNVAQSGSRGGSTTSAPTLTWTSYNSGDASLGFGFDALAGGATATGAMYAPRTVTDASSTAGSSTLTSATAAFTSDDVGKPIDQTMGASGIMFPPQSYIGAVLSSTTATIYSGRGSSAAPANAINTTSAQTVRIGRYPALVSIELGINDLQTGRTVSQVIADLTTLVNRYKNNSDIILNLPPEMNYSFISQATQADFRQQVYTLADTLDVILYDWYDRVGSYTLGVANGSYGDQNAHLMPSVYASIGASLAQAVGGGSGQAQTNSAPLQQQDLVNKRYIDDEVELRTENVSTTPTAPTTGTRLFTRSRGRRLPAFLGPAGQDNVLQPNLFSNRVLWWEAVNNSATPTMMGTATPTINSNALTAQAAAVTNFYTSMTRVRTTSTATAASAAGIRVPNGTWHLSNTVNKGGFFYVARWGLATGNTNTRGFFGMSAQTAAITTDPGGIANTVGFGWNAGQNNLQFMTVNNAAASTLVDLGSNFPVTSSFSTYFYETSIFVPSGIAGTVYYAVRRLNDGITVQGTATLTLPTTENFMTAHMTYCNGTNAVAYSLDKQSLYIETDN